MAKVKVLNIFLNNQPGSLAVVARVLANAKVNVLSLLGDTTEAQGTAQIGVDDIDKAQKALGQSQIPFVLGTLEQVELDNRPGALADYTATLAEKGININAVYGSATQSAKRAVFIFAIREQ